MNNAAAIIRSLIIYGICLPLAIYLGYVLALPMDRGSFAIVIAVVFLPLIPILLRWHHLLLILSWNMSMVLFFIQGSPYLWMAMTAVSLGLTILQQILKRNVQFAGITSVTLSLLFLALVIAITAKLTGGIGLRSLGGDSFGGKRYVQLFCAIAGYFAITSHRVTQGKGTLVVALYFLGMLTMILGSIAPWMPAGLQFIYALFPVENLDALSGGSMSEHLRLGGVTVGAVGILYFILARHGLQGLLGFSERWRFLPLKFQGGFGINQPWRILIFAGLFFLGLLGGYRSMPITFVIIFACLFYLEGLFRTRFAPAFLLVAILTMTATLPFVEKLPWSVQRSLSFLPIEISPLAKQNAIESSEWRIKIWQEVIPTIPQYLLVGKGYSIDAQEMQNRQSFEQFNANASAANALAASDYHSGPLSLIIPMGLFGTIGFLWFLAAGFRVLLNNYRHGDPVNHRTNTFLLAYFVTKTVFFFAVYGSFQNELAMFTGIVALSASINGGMCKPAVAPAKPNPAYLPFRLPKPLRA